MKMGAPFGTGSRPSDRTGFAVSPLTRFDPWRGAVAERWPRLMKRKTAAEYCDLSETSFVTEITAGRLPCGIKLGQREHWDRLALDAAISRLSGGEDEPDYRQKLRERYGQAA